jgi:zinc resistance-associated protein
MSTARKPRPIAISPIKEKNQLPRRVSQFCGFNLLKAGLPVYNPEQRLKEIRHMKASKLYLVVLLALALTMGLAASSWARPGGPGMGGMGCGMMGAMNLTPDQAGKLFDLRQKFMNDTAEVRKQMVVKRAELAALWKTEKPDEKAIVAKQKELNALKGQMQEKGVAFHLAARQIAPQLAHGFGHGMGMGMRGPGGCMGQGACPMAGPGGGAGPGGPAK